MYEERRDSCLFRAPSTKAATRVRADLVALRKRLSRGLRHRPNAAGVNLDKHRCCDVGTSLAVSLRWA